MSNRVKAALFVVLYILATFALVGTVQVILEYLQPTLEQMGIAFAILVLAYAMKMMYDLRLSQLDARDRLREITKTNPTLK
jgi:small neutral amino acid transporter SnatA (MarC family)